MSNETSIQGHQNIVIQGVTESTITLNVNGEPIEILKKLEVLISLLERQQAQSFQTADKIYNIGAIANANFDFILNQAGRSKELPEELARNLTTDETVWTQSLRRELLKKGVVVGSAPLTIFQHYGWLIEVFLQKMMTKPKEGGEHTPLRRLSFMAEAFQSSLRYLCQIQIAQLFRREEASNNPVLSDFVKLLYNEQDRYDYLNLLLLTSDLLSREDMFMPEIKDFVQELSNTDSDLYGVALFLEKYRNQLLETAILNEQLDSLLSEYLTGLVYWLRNLAFLAKYRLVSIKDINLSYRLGTSKNFVHRYGELHGMYADALLEVEDYPSKSIRDFYTYNQSILLLKGSNVATCLDDIHDPSTYLSLSPLVIDQSVFAEKMTQTPEIFFFIGQSADRRQYHFAEFKNEIPLKERSISSNKTIQVKAQNNQMPRLDELFEQLDQLFKPFRISAK